MCHSFSAPYTTVDVTDDGNLTSSCHCAATSGFGAGRDRRLPEPPGIEFSLHMWMKARRWQMGMPSWPLWRTRTPPCFQANHEGSHVDDVSDRMLAELADTCSRRVHGCAVTNFRRIQPNEGTTVSVSDRKADAAAGRCSDGAGCSVQNQKNYTWIRRQAALRGRLLVSVDNPRGHGTLLLEVGTQNSGGTVCLLVQSKAGIGPRFVRDVLSIPVKPIWPQAPA